MPRFHFSFFNNYAVRDPEGTELADLDSAIRMARKSAAEIIADEILQGNIVCLGDYIEIADDHGSTVHTLRFADLIESASPN